MRGRRRRNNFEKGQAFNKDKYDKALERKNEKESRGKNYIDKYEKYKETKQVPK